MQTLTIHASTREVAQGLYGALVDSHPEIVEGEDGSYHVAVSLRESDSQIVAILGALQRHVTERGSGPARINLEGRSYTLHGEPESESWPL